MTDITGRWALVAGAAAEHIEIDVTFDDNRAFAALGGQRLPLDVFNRRWLAGEVIGDEPPLTPLAGLVLTVAADLTFIETGVADIPWFDEEGVLEPQARPFDGRIASSSAGLFLVSDEGKQNAVFSDVPDLILRVDDGDTAISDLVTVESDRLVRVMSMITDEMYPDRVRLEYQRA